MRSRLTGEKPLAKSPFPLGVGTQRQLVVMERPTGTTDEGRETPMSTTSTRSQDWDNRGQRTALYSIRECLP